MSYYTLDQICDIPANSNWTLDNLSIKKEFEHEIPLEYVKTYIRTYYDSVKLDGTRIIYVPDDIRTMFNIYEYDKKINLEETNLINRSICSEFIESFKMNMVPFNKHFELINIDVSKMTPDERIKSKKWLLYDTNVFIRESINQNDEGIKLLKHKELPLSTWYAVCSNSGSANYRLFMLYYVYLNRFEISIRYYKSFGGLRHFDIEAFNNMLVPYPSESEIESFLDLLKIFPILTETEVYYKKIGIMEQFINNFKN